LGGVVGRCVLEGRARVRLHPWAVSAQRRGEWVGREADKGRCRVSMQDSGAQICSCARGLGSVGLSGRSRCRGCSRGSIGVLAEAQALGFIKHGGFRESQACSGQACSGPAFFTAGGRFRSGRRGRFWGLGSSARIGELFMCVYLLRCGPLERKNLFQEQGKVVRGLGMSLKFAHSL
jgi:hypothetical protein